MFGAGEKPRRELVPFLGVILCDIIDSGCEPSVDAGVDADVKRVVGETELQMICVGIGMGHVSYARSAR